MNPNMIALMERLGWTASYDQSLSPKFTMGSYTIHLHGGDKGGWYLHKALFDDNGPDTITFHNARKQHRYRALPDLLLSVACAARTLTHLSDLVNGYTPDQLRKLIQEAQEAL